MTVKGYARVSTDGQDLATQHELLKEAGATLVFSEKQSGIKTDRAALARWTCRSFGRPHHERRQVSP